METKILYQWARFRKMGNQEKRDMFSKLVEERLGIKCEAHIYRVLTRFTFQSLRRKYGEAFRFTEDEKRFSVLLEELGMSPSTVLNWYYATIPSRPLHLEMGECDSLPTGKICECCISDGLRERLKDNYEFQLVSKRLYQAIVRAELFKDELARKNVVLSDDELRKSLRRVVEYDYYQKRHKKPYTLEGDDLRVQQALGEWGVRAITVLKWFYLLRHHPELLKEVYAGKIEPDGVFEKSGMKLMNDMRGGIHAKSDVCN